MSNQQVNHVAQQQPSSVISYVKGMDPELYRAALCGSFEVISCISNWKERVTPTGNNILHVHVGRPVHKTAKEAKKVIKMEFIEEVLGDDGGSIAGYELMWKENDKGDTPLHLAARFGHKNVVRVFLERANQVNQPEMMRMLKILNRKKDTALHDAARAGHVDVVKLLVEADDPNCAHDTNEMGETPLYLAAERGSASSVSIILDTCHHSALAHPKGPCGRTPLNAAVHWGNPEMVQKLMEHDSTLIRAQDDEGLTPLHCVATERGKSQHLKVLLEYEMNNRNNKESSAVYIQDNKGRTALHIAVIQGSWDVIKTLIASCPDCIEITDNNDQNVVHYAAKWTCVARFREFLDLGHFDNIINENDIHGNTPVHILAASILRAPHHRCVQRASSFVDNNSLLDVKVFNRKHLTFGDIIVSNKKTFKSKWLLKRLIKNNPKGRRINTTVEDINVDVENAVTADTEAYLMHIVKASKSEMVVAALIATVSFTAGLTLPGGFNQNPGPNIGMAVLKSKAAFRAFVVSDILAFSCSTAAILFYFLIASSLTTTLDLQRWYWGGLLTVISLGAMGVALITGVCAVLSHSPVFVVAIWVISAVFFVCYIPLLGGSVYLFARYHIMCNHGRHEILLRRPINNRLFFAAWVVVSKFW